MLRCIPSPRRTHHNQNPGLTEIYLHFGRFEASTTASAAQEGGASAAAAAERGAAPRRVSGAGGSLAGHLLSSVAGTLRLHGGGEASTARGGVRG
eukprot:COSAG01_NODE_144_length_24108_cov_11.490441_18_plen_95_part_00